jgi:hypothetical protein
MEPAGLLAALFLKPLAVLGVAAAVTAGLRRHAAAARHAVWVGALLAILALPAMGLVLPPLPIPWLPARPAMPRTAADEHSAAFVVTRIERDS